MKYVVVNNQDYDGFLETLPETYDTLNSVETLEEAKDIATDVDVIVRVNKILSWELRPQVDGDILTFSNYDDAVKYRNEYPFSSIHEINSVQSSLIVT